jgi:hypothetical protein
MVRDYVFRGAKDLEPRSWAFCEVKSRHGDLRRQLSMAEATAPPDRLVGWNSMYNSMQMPGVGI